MRGGAEHEPPGTIVLWFCANWKPLPDQDRPQLHSHSKHSGSPTAVITTVCSLLITVFLQEPEPQVKCFLSAHLQVLQRNYLDMQSLAYNGENNLSETHSHCLFFFFLLHQALLRSNYTVSLILQWEKCLWLMCERSLNRRFATYSRSRCPADFLAGILLPCCSLQSARWYFINANDKDLITPASLVDKESLRDGGWPSGSHQERDHSAEQQR